MSEDIVLEDLPYDELRDRAFDIAERRLDLGFFVDLFNHAPAMHDVQDEGGSAGDIGGSFVETIRAAQAGLRRRDRRRARAAVPRPLRDLHPRERLAAPLRPR